MALLDVILGYDCNLACDYCTITPAMREHALDTGAVLRELRRGRDLGYDEVSFTGGEPTIRDDLIGLVRAARKLGYVDIKVQSNGLVFATPSNIDRMIAAGANRFHISIHTHDARRYDALVRREGSYPLMAAALELLASRSVTLVADVILKSDTYTALPAAIDWLDARGVRRLDLWFVSLTDGNRDNLASMPLMTDVIPSIREAVIRARRHDMTVRSLHIPRCLLGDLADIAFDPGSQRVMVVTPEASFELSESKISPRVHVPACDGCDWRARCPGVRPDYLERYGDAEIAAARSQEATIAPKRSLPRC